MSHRRRPPLLAVCSCLPLLGGCVVTSTGTHTRASGPILPGRSALGAEVQGYPAGVIAGLHGRVEVGPGEFLTARVAANVTDRQDFGEQDDEEGAGWGGGVGYRRYLDARVTGASGSGSGWLWGLRVDVWDLEIDWREAPGTPGEVRGTTDVVVLQPTVELGYGFDLSSGWRGEVVLGLGAEINLDEDGREVGEGAIGLLGVTLVPAF